MKLLVNTSNLVVGGGVQVALSFLEELKEIGKDEYFVFLSPQVGNQLELASFPQNFKFYNFEQSPARIFNRFQVARRMADLENEFQPDVVFSVFGPSYWRPKVPHIMGYAQPWFINHDSVAYSRLGLIGSLRVRILHLHAKYYVKRDGDFLIGETNIVQQKLVRYQWADEKNVFVVGNTYHKAFDKEPEKYPLPDADEKFRFITISALYKHKNLQIIRNTIPFLKELNVACRFYLTLPPEVFAQEFSGLEDWVTNIGPVSIRQCPSIYRQCHALFLPTLLECFSASYPEAMKMGLPILTSDLDFAHDVCGNAADYFDPLSPQDIAHKIKKLVCHQDFRGELIQLGKKRLQKFPTPRKRAASYLSICREVALGI